MKLVHTANPELGDVGVVVVEEVLTGGDEIALLGAIATLLRPGTVAEERMGEPDVDVRFGVGGQSSAGHVRAAQTRVPVAGQQHVDAAHVEPTAGRFVQQSRRFPYYSLVHSSEVNPFDFIPFFLSFSFYIILFQVI